MSRIRLALAALAVTAACLLTACGSGATSVTEPSAAVSESVSSSAESSASSQASEQPTESAAGGTFCDTFASLTDPALNNISSPAEASAKFRELAGQLRDTAPAEVSEAANDYAQVFETLAAALDGNEVDPAEAQESLSDALSSTNTDSIVKIASYVATNCS